MPDNPETIAPVPALELAPILAISIAVFVTTFDITAVIMIMPNIRESMALSIGGFAWIMDSYSLTFTVLLAAAGVLADRYGCRLVILFGNVVFLLASLACGFAENQTALLAGRVAQGAGAAFIVCGGLALIGHRYVEPRERARAFGLLGSITGLAMAFGPVGGGFIASALSWHWIFLLNIPICIAVSVAIWRYVGESKDLAQRRVDVPGLLALSLFLVSAVWILLHGPSLAGFNLGSVFGACWVAALGLGFFITQFRAKEPIIDVMLFRSPSFLGTCLVPLALSLGYWAVLVYLPLFLQDHLRRSLNETSILMLAATLPMVLLPMVSARLYLASRPSTFFSAGLAVVALGCGVLAAAAQLRDLPLSVVGMLIAGSGTAMTHSQVSGVIIALVPHEQAGAASAVLVILRQGGFALGIAILASVLRTAMDDLPPFMGSMNPYALLFLSAGACAAVSAIPVFVLIGRERNAAVKSS